MVDPSSGQVFIDDDERINPGFLRAYADLTPSYVEGCEALEQLRALWHGYRISVTLADDMPLPGVDTPEDAARVRAYFAGRCAGN